MGRILNSVPIASMLRLPLRTASHIGHYSIGSPEQGLTLAPNEVLDFYGVLLRHK
jgi:hypothetical protein